MAIDASLGIHPSAVLARGVGRARRTTAAHTPRAACLCDDEEYLALSQALLVAEHAEGSRRASGGANPRDPSPGEAAAELPSLVRIRESESENILSTVRSEECGLVLLGSRQMRSPGAVHEVARLRAHGIPVQTVQTFSAGLLPAPTADTAEATEELWIRPRRDGLYRTANWLLDMVAVLVALVVLLVIGPVVAMAIRATSPGPVFYRQLRVGVDGRLFHIVKFRTMSVDAEAGGPRFASLNDDRATSVGAFLRKSRIDELPQIWNVLRREMSLIGPRPERPEFVESFVRTIPRYGNRHLVRPGITGWAQVMEGYTDDPDGTARKLGRDLHYLEHQGPRLDAEILVRTVGVVIGFAGR
ncbi:lipopolysaccharide/colanic/teichoic acid biosynthesis glycosyltransferase [Kineococcus xinjiangensis]|uniref:Lipopolysaccharide/colanic/teichoic acid biosynthesis glycosyltransferase n=1 Tax=Kineococcus xinjiangensis TaxID=512762 RepID=A0A2S6II84_9ACTN|nr:sugar transferase [Kineococcus xinjiangensis]PPK93896.1 lipopolysaccharide/colanic/teichoic acid biosynthesis glycosyltransferase [Kineococcus xinjiangensis]